MPLDIIELADLEYGLEVGINDHVSSEPVRDCFLSVYLPTYLPTYLPRFLASIPRLAIKPKLCPVIQWTNSANGYFCNKNKGEDYV
jgi:hypothetical protein